MSYKTLVSLLLALVLLLPTVAFAQDGEDEFEFEPYEDPYGVFTTVLPVGWFVDEEAGVGTFSIGTSEESLNIVYNSDILSVPTGEFVVFIQLLPIDLLPLVGIELTEETTLEEVAATMADALISDTNDIIIEFGEAIAFTIEGETEDESIEVGAVSITSETAEGTLAIFYPSEDLLAMVIAAAAPGEFDDFSDVLDAIGLSFEVLMTAEEMQMVDMTGGADDADMLPTVAPVETEESSD